ncbi:MAG: radical SAM protein [Acidobacteria bacterium RIFCSPLOWO2_02_FULL_68_18]|nr:MAG: radical SAM protein [Acidobacteria bacterium RIFCSPLOWO2_02_FULL_68_18]OFW48609.1 MAG: radical SAM protein [Acidobacteria bacterium RIFCSPLOWO2_12_FULL_68_19]
MTVYLINPSHVSFGIGVITPRWLYVLASATPTEYGDPRLVDETLEPFDTTAINAGDVVGIGIHTGNALRGYEIGTTARARGAYVVFGGIHATLYPDEARAVGGAHAVVTGDGERVFPLVLRDCAAGTPRAIYDGGRIEADECMPGRWELLPEGRYMWASVQTVRGCPKHCSFCSVWRTDGQRPRQRHVDRVLDEIVELRRRGFRFIALADDNFYPVTLNDIRMASRRENPSHLEQLKATRAERFELMAGLAGLPADTVFFTQITMEAAEDPAFLDAMRRANIKGALVGVESVTPEGLKDVYKDFNANGEALVERLRTFREHGVHVLGSFIFGLPSDRPATFDACLSVAERSDLTFAQFVMLTPFPGTLDFTAWEKSMGSDPPRIGGVPVTRHWLIPQAIRPKVYVEHPVMSAEEIRRRTQLVWDRFYSLRSIWHRSRAVQSLRARLAFLLISKIYRQMYANTGIATDSARVNRSAQWARLMAIPCRRLFAGRPMPDLQVPAL